MGGVTERERPLDGGIERQTQCISGVSRGWASRVAANTDSVPQVTGRVVPGKGFDFR